MDASVKNAKPGRLRRIAILWPYRLGFHRLQSHPFTGEDGGSLCAPRLDEERKPFFSRDAEQLRRRNQHQWPVVPVTLCNRTNTTYSSACQQ
jgi:hypothetical protein